MAIVVKALSEDFKVEITAEEEKLIFTFKQLDFKTKNLITSLITGVEGGQYTLDTGLQIFLNIKYGLVDVEGLVDEEGNKYELRRESEKGPITDDCVDELLATAFTNQLQFTARELGRAVLPTEIKNPLTGKAVEGVKIVSGTKGVKKKSSKA